MSAALPAFLDRRGEQIGFHPLANIFPLLEGDNYNALVDDIRAHGMHEAIILYGGQILDGRNRYRACIDAGREPFFTEYDGDDPLAHVLSLNLHRRHLSESQRAMVAAKIANLKDGQRADLVEGLPIGRAASLLNVGERSVARAREVLAEGAPDLQRAVELGAVSVSAAADVATLPQDQQREIVAKGNGEILDAAKRVRAGRVNFNSGETEWYTPSEYIETARLVLGAIDLDPASSSIAQERVRAARFCTKEDDGLVQEWHGRVWLNPPYAQPDIGKFISKLVAEYQTDNVTDAILLTNDCTDTKWFHEAAAACSAICFTSGHIAFQRPDGTTGSPLQGQAFFYFGTQVDLFAHCFGELGRVLLPAGDNQTRRVRPSSTSPYLEFYPCAQQYIAEDLLKAIAKFGEIPAEIVADTLLSQILPELRRRFAFTSDGESVAQSVRTRTANEQIAKYIFNHPCKNPFVEPAAATAGAAP